MESQERRLSLNDKLAWAVGQIGEGVKTSAFNAFILFYYNQILGVSATLTALAMGFAVFSDAITDPIAGSISDRFHSRWGRRHPFMTGSAIPMAVVLFLLFNPPAGLSQLFYFAWLAICAAGVNLFMTLYHIPHLALGAEMSKGYMERTSLFSFGSLFGSVAGWGFYFFCLTVFFPSSPDFANGMYNPEGYVSMSGLAGVLIVVSILACVWWTRKHIPYLRQTDPTEFTDKQKLAIASQSDGGVSEREVPPLREIWHTIKSMKAFAPAPSALYTDLKTAFSSPSYRVIFVGMLFSTIVLTIEGVFNAFMGIHFWGLATEELRWIGVAVVLALPAGTMAAPMINRLLDKRMSVIIPSIIAILNGNVLIILRLTEVLPPNGDPIILPLILLTSFIGGSVVPVIYITLNSMFADIADELDLVTGKRQEGVIYAARAFAAKAATSIGLVIGGLALDLIRFPRQAPPGTVDPDVIFNLGLVQGPGTSIFVLAALSVYIRYKLDKTRHAEIMAKIYARDQAAAERSDKT